jgi:hypothetical protein
MECPFNLKVVSKMHRMPNGRVPYRLELNRNLEFSRQFQTNATVNQNGIFGIRASLTLFDAK